MAESAHGAGSPPVTGRHRRGPSPAVLAGLVLAAGFAALTLLTFDFPQEARGYPLFVMLGGVVLLCGVAAANHRSLADAESAAGEHLRDPRVLGFLAVWVLYAFAMVAVGFLISTTAALAASLLVLRIRRAWLWALGSMPAALLCFALLQVELNIALPQSPLDRAVADVLYDLRG